MQHTRLAQGFPTVAKERYCARTKGNSCTVHADPQIYSDPESKRVPLVCKFSPDGVCHTEDDCVNKQISQDHKWYEEPRFHSGYLSPSRWFTKRRKRGREKGKKGTA